MQISYRNRKENFVLQGSALSCKKFRDVEAINLLEAQKTVEKIGNKGKAREIRKPQLV